MAELVDKAIDAVSNNPVPCAAKFAYVGVPEAALAIAKQIEPEGDFGAPEAVIGGAGKGAGWGIAGGGVVGMALGGPPGAAAGAAIGGALGGGIGAAVGGVKYQNKQNK